MFMSDNGAEGAAYEAYPLVSGPLMDHIRKYYNNDLDNIGAADSFVWYGPRWAQAATAPSRLYKLYTTEGGVRVPCIASYAGIPTGIKHDFATVMDIAPTLLEMAGVAHPAPNYNGRLVAHMRGKSMFSWLKVIISDHQVEYKYADRFHREIPNLFIRKTSSWAGSYVVGLPFVPENGKPCLFLLRRALTSGSYMIWALMQVKFTILPKKSQRSFRSFLIIGISTLKNAALCHYIPNTAHTWRQWRSK